MQNLFSVLCGQYAVIAVGSYINIQLRISVFWVQQTSIIWGWREMSMFLGLVFMMVYKAEQCFFSPFESGKKRSNLSKVFLITTEKSESLICEKHGQLETNHPSPMLHDLHSSISLFCAKCHLRSHRKSRTTNSSANNRISLTAAVESGNRSP